MKLIDAYIYEVTRRLPEKSREDIAMELRSTIEDMLPELYTEEEVKAVLAELGDPAKLAASYRDTPMYLIGPKVYDVYLQTLKKTMPWAIFVTVIIHAVIGVMEFSGDEAVLSAVLKIFGNIVANAVMVSMYVLFWISAVFVMIDRVNFSKNGQPLPTGKAPWTPDDLEKVEIVPRRRAILKGEAIFGLIWTAFWSIVYFNADHLVGIYQSVDGGLKFVQPLANQDELLSYWPVVVLLIVMETGLAIYKWKAGQWTVKLAAANTAVHFLGAVVILVIASNPNLINPAFIPYIAESMGITVSPVFGKSLWRIILAGVIVSIIIEAFDNFRKAKGTSGRA